MGAFADAREPLLHSPPLMPEGLLSGPVALDLCADGAAFALAGGPLAFTHARIGNELLAARDLRRRARFTLESKPSTVAELWQLW